MTADYFNHQRIDHLSLKTQINSRQVPKISHQKGIYIHLKVKLIYMFKLLHFKLGCFLHTEPCFLHSFFVRTDFQFESLYQIIHLTLNSKNICATLEMSPNLTRLHLLDARFVCNRGSTANSGCSSWYIHTYTHTSIYWSHTSTQCSGALVCLHHST